jgi:hypothetical protein
MIVKHFKDECLDAKNFISYQHNFKQINEVNFYYWDRPNLTNEINEYCVAKFTLKLKPNVNTQKK